MLNFSSPILLESVRACGLVYNAKCGKEFMALSINEFSTVIRPDHFYFGFKLIVNHEYELTQSFKHSNFVMNQYGLSGSSMIINYGEEIVSI